MLRLMLYSAFRCDACGHRHYRFNVVGVAGTAVVVLLVTGFFSVANMVSKPYDPSTGSPVAARKAGLR